MENKKLRDLASKNHEEIHSLQNELQKWHFKTFPTFIETNQYYPDRKTARK